MLVVWRRHPQRAGRGHGHRRLDRCLSCVATSYRYRTGLGASCQPVRSHAALLAPPLPCLALLLALRRTVPLFSYSGLEPEVVGLEPGVGSGICDFPWTLSYHYIF